MLPPTRLELDPHFYACAIVKTTQCHLLLVVQDTTSEVDRSETRKGNGRNNVGVLAFRELGVPCDSDFHGRRRVIRIGHRNRSHAMGIEWFRLQGFVHRIGEDLRSALDTPPLYFFVFREVASRGLGCREGIHDRCIEASGVIEIQGINHRLLWRQH